MKSGMVIKAVLGVACCTLAVQSAKSDSITYLMDVGNSTTTPPDGKLSAYQGPYGEVTVNRTSSTSATITFTSLTALGNIYLFGDGGTAGVNVNASSWSIGSFSDANSGSGFSSGSQYLSDSGGGNEDGFGNFNQTVKTFDGFTHASDTVSFVLTDTGGTWSSAGSVLIANASGYLVGAHVFVTADPANANNGALVTGFAAGNTVVEKSPVPDGGSTVALLGFALLGIGALRQSLSRK
jgi:hypothetical protein